MNKADWSNEHRLSILGHPIAGLRVREILQQFPGMVAPGWKTQAKRPAGLEQHFRPRRHEKSSRSPISPEEWDALPKSEQDLIQSWAEELPISVFYD